MRKLLNIAQYIGAIATIGGAALWFDAKFDASHENDKIMMDSISELRQEILYVNTEQMFMAEDIYNIKDEIEKNSEGVNHLIWIERNRKQFTPEQMETLLDEWLKKKYEWTPYGWNISDSIKLETMIYGLHQ